MKEEQRGDERGEKRHVKMKEKVKDKRREDREKRRERTRREKKQDEEERDKMKRRWKGEWKRKWREEKRRKRCFFFQKNVSRQSNPPDELAQNVSKKNPRRTNYSSFFSAKVQNLAVFFIYLHDSNSCFWARGINSEIFSGGTVMLEDWEEFISLTLRTRN